MKSQTSQTHIVLKISDCQSYLSPMEYQNLLYAVNKIGQGRLDEGKDIAEYLIVNTDEVYAFLVRQLIEREESKKC